MSKTNRPESTKPTTNNQAPKVDATDKPKERKPAIVLSDAEKATAAEAHKLHLACLNGGKHAIVEAIALGRVGEAAWTATGGKGRYGSWREAAGIKEGSLRRARAIARNADAALTTQDRTNHPSKAANGDTVHVPKLWTSDTNGQTWSLVRCARDPNAAPKPKAEPDARAQVDVMASKIEKVIASMPRKEREAAALDLIRKLEKLIKPTKPVDAFDLGLDDEPSRQAQAK